MELEYGIHGKTKCLATYFDFITWAEGGNGGRGGGEVGAIKRLIVCLKCTTLNKCIGTPYYF